jgi:hypothetical protein
MVIIRGEECAETGGNWSFEVDFWRMKKGSGPPGRCLQNEFSPPALRSGFSGGDGGDVFAELCEGVDGGFAFIGADDGALGGASLVGPDGPITVEELDEADGELEALRGEEFLNFKEGGVGAAVGESFESWGEDGRERTALGLPAGFVEFVDGKFEVHAILARKKTTAASGADLTAPVCRGILQRRLVR